MAGIYVHIPYCKKACYYCNFHFSVSLRTSNDFVQALLKEIVLQKNFLDQEPVSTIYFGGGTPSLLKKEDLQQILQQLQTHFSISAQPEITLEANPDDITATSLADWKAAGINRLSIGIQSFFEEDLQWMNRAHNAQQAKDCIALARQAGFANYSIDLIYGGPGLTDEKWKQNVQQAVAMKIPHLSCYALTVEPGTALQKMIQLQKKAPVDTDKQARHFLLLMDWLQQAGYLHYEISNFALPGYYSQHNSSYWGGKKYLGLGPSAHSFNGSYRQWNIANNALYIAALNRNEIPCEQEKLTPAQQLNEYIMVSLRTSEGIDPEYIKKVFGEGISAQILQNSRKYLAADKLCYHKNRLQLTKEGKLFADGIAADLFFLEEELKARQATVNDGTGGAGSEPPAHMQQ